MGEYCNYGDEQSSNTLGPGPCFIMWVHHEHVSCLWGVWTLTPELSDFSNLQMLNGHIVKFPYIHDKNICKTKLTNPNPYCLCCVGRPTLYFISNLLYRKVQLCIFMYMQHAYVYISLSVFAHVVYVFIWKGFRAALLWYAFVVWHRMNV